MHKLRRITLSLASKEFQRVFSKDFVQKTSRCMSTVDNPPSATPVPQFSIPKGILGQPTCHTHPHMISKENLTCGITQAEYRERRETLVRKLAAEVENMHKTHIIVIPASRKQFMSDKIPYVFRQNSDFFYLTGCLEPSAIIVMVKPAQTDSYKSVIFVHEKDSHAELWEGPRTGCADAVRLFAVDEARPVDNFSSFLNKMTATSKPSILWYHNESPANPDIHSSVRSVLRHDSQVLLSDPQRALHFMRVIKSPAEVALMRDACYVGAQSVNMAMACTKPGVSEHAINAVLEYSVRLSGAEHAAFPPVVGGGARATHIHYVNNNQLLGEKEMLLVDSGCQRWMYNSDISRTWPVSGKFSKYHKILYELILSVQKRLIELVGEHRPPLDQLFDNMCRLLGARLQAEGILSKDIDSHRLIGKRLIELVGEHRPPLDQLFDNMCRLLGARLQAEGILSKDIDSHRLIGEAYRLCPHHVSHYLGLDVHDAPLVRRATPLRTNMVITVEPGIYIRPDDEKVPPEFRGVGIRIEDDVLITDGEPLVLTDSCVKEVADIEAIVGKHTL